MKLNIMAWFFNEKFDFVLSCIYFGNEFFGCESV